MLAECRDQQEFLKGCAAAWNRIDKMGGLEVYHERIRMRQEKKRGQGWVKAFKWKRDR
jgi:hypothetical protein